jgi:hypothetical protein
MRTTILAAAALATLAALSLGPAAEARTVTTQGVRGHLLPTDDTSDAIGAFRILVQTRGEASREMIGAEMRGLDATKDGDGNLPSYHCWLVNADGSLEGDFGACRLSDRGRARFRFASPRQDLPEGVTSLVDFAGGSIEIRLDSTVVLAGRIPDFLGLTDDNDRGSGAATWAFGAKRLRATEDGGRAKGFVEALYVNRPRVTAEAIRIECMGLGSAGDVFTAVVVDDDGNETELGTMTSRTRYGVAVLALSTRRGDTIPGDGVLSFGGHRIEIRDAGGTAWLEGRFPILARE